MVINLIITNMILIFNSSKVYNKDNNLYLISYNHTIIKFN